MSTGEPSSPTAVIADDERLLREQLSARLSEVWPELEIVGEAKNGTEAVELVEEHHPDLVFLDIRMPGKSGLDAAVELADEWPQDQPFPALVFVTAFDQYAVQAFEHRALDYLVKPVEAERLADTVARLKTRLGEDRAPAAGEALHCLRVTVGTPAENDRFLVALAGALDELAR